MGARQYILFCDESIKEGKFYSNFYGGVIVSARDYERVTRRLNAQKKELGFGAELKWEKVSPNYLEKYKRFISAFFEEVKAGRLRVRIMFRQNAHSPVSLTKEQIGTAYYRLYYQFIKNAFGLSFMESSPHGTRLRLYFDEFPDTGEGVAQFKDFLLALQHHHQMQHLGLKISPEDIADLRSHDHILLQCVDIVLGAMQFRLNDKHLMKAEGAKRRGKKTLAKEKLYKHILQEVRILRPGFNIGVNTSCTPVERWTLPYRHWCFRPYEAEFRSEFTKKGIIKTKKSDPT